MRVIIAGGRDVFPSLTGAETTFLDDFHAKYHLTLVITGGARGIDAWAADWASRRGINQVIFPANWIRNRRRAGPERNYRMAVFLANSAEQKRVILFPGGSGTANMADTAKEYGLPRIFYPSFDEVL